MSKDKEPKYLYQKTKDGYIPYPFKKGEEEKYRNICIDVWGGVLCDVNYVMNSVLYKTKQLN